LLNVVFTAAGVALLLNAAFLGVSANFHSGIVFTGLAGAALFLYGLFFARLRNAWLLHVILATGLVLAVCLPGFLFLYGKTDTAGYTEDALIVLGAAIRGEVPSYPLYTRLEAAVDYHARNPEAMIVVSGGQGFQETISEALAMERYLLRRGVSPDRIIREDRATSTFENFKYSKELLDVFFDNAYTIAFVTSDFHVFRAARTARALRLVATHRQAPILWYTVPANVLRECAAIARNFLFGYR